MIPDGFCRITLRRRQHAFEPLHDMPLIARTATRLKVVMDDYQDSEKPPKLVIRDRPASMRIQYLSNAPYE